MMETMTKTETALCHLVRLHYSGDQRSFDQLARNLLASNNSALGRGQGQAQERYAARGRDGKPVAMMDAQT
jgi:hypothetical protein